MKTKKANLKKIIPLLKRYYPDAECALVHSNPLELLIATMMSAQCTDARVNIVTAHLFQKYPTVQEYAAADLAELEHAIRSINFFRNKAKNIKAMAQILIDQYGGEVPKTLEALVELPGVGRKTANVVLGNAFDIPSGVVVDTHVGRLSQRLGLTNEKTPERIEIDLMRDVPQKNWIDFSHWLILHGRSICKARKPLCETCFLDEHCPKRI